MCFKVQSIKKANNERADPLVNPIKKVVQINLKQWRKLLFTVNQIFKVLMKSFLQQLRVTKVTVYIK